MKAKIILQILSVLFIGLMYSFCYGSDDFYYGNLHCLGIGTEYLSWQKDSLKSNIGFSADINSSNIQYFVNDTMRAIPENEDTTNESPKHWARVSYYTLWEAEAYPESYYHLHYYGGALVSDSNAHSGQAMKLNCSATSRLIQWGPSYVQEDKYNKTDSIKYTAEFRLKFVSALSTPPGEKSGNPPVPVCSLMVVDTLSHTILKHLKLYRSNFTGGGYKAFLLSGYTVSDTNNIDFQIYLFGTTDAAYFYIDYVKSYDENGYGLIDLKRHDQDIIDYVDSNWVHTTLPGSSETVVYRWYLHDEPGFFDSYRPIAYVDSLLRQTSQERAGFQFLFAGGTWQEVTVHEYLLRANPKDFGIDIYPTGWFDPCTLLTGPQYQETWDKYFGYLNRAKTIADSLNKELWIAVQAHTTADLDSSGTCLCPIIRYDGNLYCSRDRNPTPNEVRFQTFSCLCYGADAIMNYSFPFSRSWDKTYMETGLADTIGDTTTCRFKEIKDFTGQRTRVLGQQIKLLTWQGACSNQEVGSFVLRNIQSSYIDSIIGRHHDSTYVQVGFFDDGNSDYFMVVNRKCLDTEYESLKVYVDISGGPWLAIDMFTNEPIDKVCGLSPLIVPLQPGEGRLFKLVKYLDDDVIYVYHSLPHPTIQSAIDAANPWTTIIVYDSVYHENIDFKGKNVTVTSWYHIDGDTSHISHTIIDGSQPTDTTIASVVRFTSGENYNAVLKGFTIRHGKGTKYISKDRDCKYGGGVYCKDSSPIIINNVITADTVNCDGGGIYCDDSSPQILSNVIKQNKAIWNGGSIAISTSYGGSSAPVLANNIVDANSAEHRGGGLYYWGNPVITNNIIDGNAATWSGGGIYVGMSATGRIENNIIVNSTHGNGISGVDGPEVMSYNDVYDNDSLDFDIIYPSGVGNLYWGFNRKDDECDTFFNISQNPYSENGYHCINAGDNNASGLVSFDFDGNPRIVDEFVDIGAYEYQGGSKGGNAKIASSDTNSNKLHLPAETPKEFGLSQSYPNPFNPTAVIEFTIGSDHPSNHITLKVYNITGQLVKTLVDEEKSLGTYTVTWDGRNNSNEEVASGIYFYELKSNNLKETKRMVLIK
jgi:parallel beta-helix repeat protein